MPMHIKLVQPLGQERAVLSSRHMFRLALIAFFTLGFLLTAPLAAQDQESVEDIDITDAIETDLWIDDAVNANDIDIETFDGIVTLTGDANSILAKERAATLASATVGVRAVVNRIEVNPDKNRSDSELQDAVREVILEDPVADAYEIETTVTDGIVALTGTVDSWQEKQLSATVVKNVTGVRGVENNTTIDYDMDRPDSEILAEIEKRLANDVRVDDKLLKIDVYDGRVQLEGTVGSLTEKNRAVADAWVSGVTSVEADDIEIRWWMRDDMRRKSTYVTRTDEEIKSAVKDAFLYDPRLYSFNPEVTVDDGTVTLTGVVSNLRAKQAAEQDARNTVGVWRVKNHLKIRPEMRPLDSELEEQVGQAIGENPYVSRFDVVVDAHNGRVTLSGIVNNSFEKTIAKQVASTVKGVTGVTNNLDYEYVWNWKPDMEIKEDVRDELFWSPFVEHDEVNVDVDRGVVTLDGNVDTWSERFNAEDAAWDAGAKDVRNHLTVTYRYYGPYPPRWPYLSPDNTVVEYHTWAWPPGK